MLAFFAGCTEVPEQDRAEELRNRILEGRTDKVLVVAHRGDWRYAPENSLAGIHTRHQVPTLEEALLAAKGKVLVNLDKADRYLDLVVPVLEKTGTIKQIIMKGGRPAESVIASYGDLLDEILYMPIVNLYKDDARQIMEGHMTVLKPSAYELTYRTDDQLDYPLQLRKDLSGKALLWYNTLWDTLCGGHDDDLALEDPDAAYGFLIDTLGATIIQTDRAEYLLSYLRSRNLHD